MNMYDMPRDWEDCTHDQLVWLREHGGYMQRIIAERYLRAEQMKEAVRVDAAGDQTGAEKLRASLKKMGPPPIKNLDLINNPPNKIMP